MAWMYCIECDAEIDYPTLRKRCVGKHSCPRCSATYDIADDEHREALGELVDMVENLTRMMESK